MKFNLGDKNSTNKDYHIRQFGAEDAAVYKAIRLEALQQHPGNYGNSYLTEAGFTGNHWVERLTNPGCACFGLYSGDELIGLTGIIVDQDEPESAYMTQSYIRDAHKNKGLSRMLYQARIDWAKQQGIKRLVIGHRKNNLASKAANQKFGFTYTHSEERTWPDGNTEDMLYYELHI